MGFCDQLSQSCAMLVRRGTQIVYHTHEPAFSTGSLSDLVTDQPVQDLAAKLVKGTPGYVRKAVLDAYMQDNAFSGSLMNQSLAGMNKLNAGSEFLIYGYSMGAAMAVLDAIMAVNSRRFSKIRLVLVGGVKTISQETADWLVKNGVEIECYEMGEDVVTDLDGVLNLSRLILLPWQFLQPGDILKLLPRFVVRQFFESKLAAWMLIGQ
jgi:hypothetical protein